MTRQVRIGLFLGGLAALGGILVAALGELPGFGHYPGPYGTTIARTGLVARHATDLVTAVNFDYRAFDTLGEEFIVFAAVIGVAILLRTTRGEGERPPDEPGEEHPLPGTSSLLGPLGLALVGPLLVLGGYIVTHGQLTPGGGFQGGVVLAASALVAFLAGEYVAFKVVAPRALVEAGEAASAAGFALIGVGGLVFSGVFFQNFIALGRPGSILSSGTIPFSNVAVGFEIAGAFLVLWTEFSDQALLVRAG